MSEKKVRDDRPFFSEFMLIDFCLGLLFFGVLLTLAVWQPAEVGVKADLLQPAPEGIRPEWYFMFLFKTLKFVPAHMNAELGEALCIGVFALGALFFLFVPFLDRNAARERRSPWFTAIFLAVLGLCRGLPDLGLSGSRPDASARDARCRDLRPLGRRGEFGAALVGHRIPVVLSAAAPRGEHADSEAARMKIHEYQAKQLLPRSRRRRARRIGRRYAAGRRRGLREPRRKRAVVKAQIHAGGRGKGTIADSARRNAASNWSAAATKRETVAANLLGHRLVTDPDRTRRQDRPPRAGRRSLLDRSGNFISGVVVDRAAGRPCSSPRREGGMEIEHVAATMPERIFTEPLRSALRAAAASDPQARLAAGPAGRRPAHGRTLPAAAGAAVSRQGLQPRGDQSPGADRRRSTPGLGRQDDLRRQRPVPPSRVGQPARSGRGRAGRSPGRPRRD